MCESLVSRRTSSVCMAFTVRLALCAEPEALPFALLDGARSPRHDTKTCCRASATGNSTMNFTMIELRQRQNHRDAVSAY